MLPVGAVASIVAPVEDAAATVRHTSQLAQRPAYPAALAAAIPRVLLREGERPEWDTYLHAVYGEHPQPIREPKERASHAQAHNS